MDSFRKASGRKKLWLCLAAISLLAVMFSFPYQFPSIQTYGSGAASATQVPQYHFLAQGGQGSVSILLEAEPSAHYSFFNLNIPETVHAAVNATSLTLSNDTVVSMLTSFTPSSIVVLDTLANGSTITLHARIQKGVFASFVGVQFTVPA
ncbi:MAG: hypothetical protein ACRECH_09850, partial [Nitrososphaerales archaeon]